MNNDYDDVEMFLVPSEEKNNDLKVNAENDIIIEDEKAVSSEDSDTLKDYGVNNELLENNNISVNDFLKFARNHAKEDVNKYIDKLKESKEDQVIDNRDEQNEQESKEEINLSTRSIKSLITDEKIDLIKFNIFDRIEEIYYHTGVSVNVKDSMFASECNRGLSSFSRLLNSMDKTYVNEAKSKLGPNWQQKLLESYTESWNRIMGEEIEKEIEKGAKRREEYRKTKEENNKLEKDKNNDVARVVVREVKKEKLKDLKKDLLHAKKTAVLSNNGEHIIYKNGSVIDNDSINVDSTHIRK